MNSYEHFIQNKQLEIQSCGFKIEKDKLNTMLFEFQKDIIRWSLAKGKSCIFAGTGLGKTPMQLEWSNQVHNYTNGNILIVAPLSVTEQTKREGEKFGVSVNICRTQEDVKSGINITNYEMLEKFISSKFVGVVLDESSILKHFDSKTKILLCEMFSMTQYKLCCSATPSPNDFVELGNHSEFLGVMSQSEMKSMFFINDGGKSNSWRLKKHAEGIFWKWLCNFSVVLNNPYDLDYIEDGNKFILPKLNKFQKVHKTSDEPIIAKTMTERRIARKETTKDRCQKAVEIIGDSDEQYIIWCGLNYEQDLVYDMLKDKSVSIFGSLKNEQKIEREMQWRSGEKQILITKPKIFGFGINWQHCRNAIYIGLSDSFEELYQSIRRIYRFGQTKETNIYIITSDREGEVLTNINNKEENFIRMTNEMVKLTKEILKKEIKQTTKITTEYNANLKIILPKWEEMRKDEIMKILDLKVKNFKGLKELSINFEGKNFNVFGDNATGKSSIADAIYWLFFGKNMEDKKVFEIKPIGNSKVEIEVSINIENNGKIIPIKRIYKEKYTKKTGNIQAELTGHETKYFIDNKPKKQKEFDLFINDLLPEDKFKILTNPLYFTSLDWKKQRQLMISLIDNKEIEKNILSDEEFNLISEFLDDYEESVKSLNSQKKELNKKLDELPSRIDELKNQLNDSFNIDEDIKQSILEQIDNKNNRIAEIKKQNMEIKEEESKYRNEFYSQIESIESKIRELKSKDEDNYNQKLISFKGKINDYNKMIAELESYLSQIDIKNNKIQNNKTLIQQLQNEISNKTTELNLIENQLVELRNKWNKENGLTFDLNDNDKLCKACGQELPSDLKGIKFKKLKEEFENNKKHLLESIQIEGKLLKDKKAAIESIINGSKIKIQKLEEEKNKIKEEMKSNENWGSKDKKIIEDEINKIIQNKIQLEKDIDAIEKIENPEILNYYNKINELKVKAENVVIKADSNEICLEESNLNELKEKLIKYEQSEKMISRINELESEMKGYSDKQIDIEENIIILQKFYIEKMKRMENELVKLFDGEIGFKVFHHQINEGIRECFEITVKKVPWNSVNSSGKIKAGLQIINLLATKYDFYPFILIDNKESIVKLPEMKQQLITFIVKEGSELNWEEMK